MTYRSSHNLGVAMATPSGLLVPNVKDVQDKSVLEVARELNRLQELGAAGKLSRDDLTGGTFSLSNIGAVGGTYCRPVLVVPEVMIGAIGKTRRLPRFGPDDEIVAAHIMEVRNAARGPTASRCMASCLLAPVKQPRKRAPPCVLSFFQPPP